jgi:hypothetical protein
MGFEQTYYYILKNKDISEYMERYDRPYSDHTYIEGGFLKGEILDKNGKVITQENIKNQLKELNYVLKYNKLDQYFNQTLVDDDKNGNLNLTESGYYFFTLAAAGYNNENNHSKFEGWWRKITLKDSLQINSDFTWRREKEIDDGFFLTWEGTYQFAKDIIIFSLLKNGYEQRDDNNNYLIQPVKTNNVIQYYGLMIAPITDSHKNKIVLTAFLDNSKTDLMNFSDKLYIDKTKSPNISGYFTLDNLASSGISLVDTINQGGRGELIQGIFYYEYDIDKNGPYKISYEIGNYDSGNGISKVTGLSTYTSYNNFTKSALKGLAIETEPYHNFFGGGGGNVIKNNFDFYEKSEYDKEISGFVQTFPAENGYFKLMYTGPNKISLKPYTVSAPPEIEILDPYEKETIDDAIVYQISGVYDKNNLYIRIPERSLELDTDNSKFESFFIDSGSTLTPFISGSISEMNMSNGKKMFSITELDNHRRILTFNVNNNYNSSRPIYLDLQTKKREFHIAIAKDNYIDKIIIKNSKYSLDNQDFLDDDDISRFYTYVTENGNIVKQDEMVFNYEDTFDIEIHYKDSNYALMNHIFELYLKDCIGSISSSNGGIQTIKNFKMPKRDVLLFLKTEQQYTLMIYRDSSSTHIKSIADAVNNEDFPIVEKHYWNDYIKLPITFTGGDGFLYEIDKDYLISQLPSIMFRSHDPDDPCPDNYNKEICDEEHNGRERDLETHKFKGDEYVYFYMPDYDLTLYIREIKPHVRLSFSLENQNFSNGKITEIYVTDKEEKSPGFRSVNLLTSSTSTESNYVELFPNTNINVYIKFSNLKVRLDTNYLNTQILNVCNKPGKFFLITNGTKNEITIPPSSTTIGGRIIDISSTSSTLDRNAKMYQQFSFDIDELKSSTSNKVLKLKVEDRYYSFIINYAASYLISDININSNKKLSDDLNRLYEGESLTITFNLKQYYLLDTSSTTKSKYFIDNTSMGNIKGENNYDNYNPRNICFTVSGAYSHYNGGSQRYINVESTYTTYDLTITATIRDYDVIVNLSFKLYSGLNISFYSNYTKEKSFSLEKKSTFYVTIYGGKGYDGCFPEGWDIRESQWSRVKNSHVTSNDGYVFPAAGTGGCGLFKRNYLVTMSPGEVILKTTEGGLGGIYKTNLDQDECTGSPGGKGGTAASLIYKDVSGRKKHMIAFGGGGGGGAPGYDGTSGGTGSGGGGAGTPAGYGLPPIPPRIEYDELEYYYDYSSGQPVLNSRWVHRVEETIPNYNQAGPGTWNQGSDGGRGENWDYDGNACKGGTKGILKEYSLNGLAFIAATSGYGGQSGGGGGAPSCGGGGGASSHYVAAQRGIITRGEKFKISVEGDLEVVYTIGGSYSSSSYAGISLSLYSEE